MPLGAVSIPLSILRVAARRSKRLAPGGCPDSIVTFKSWADFE
jgi:hypothetical protein